MEEQAIQRLRRSPGQRENRRGLAKRSQTGGTNKREEKRLTNSRTTKTAPEEPTQQENIKSTRKKISIYDHRDQTLFRSTKKWKYWFRVLKQNIQTQKNILYSMDSKACGVPPVNKPKATGGKRSKNGNSGDLYVAKKVEVKSTWQHVHNHCYKCKSDKRCNSHSGECQGGLLKMKKHSMLKGPHMAKSC